MGQTKTRKRFELRLPWRGALTSTKTQAELARTYRKNFDLDAAEKILREASNACPGDLDLQTQMAETAMARKDWATAVAHWKEILDSHGTEVPADVFARAACAIRQRGDLDEADAVARQGLQMHTASAPLLREIALSATDRENWGYVFQRAAYAFRSRGDLDEADVVAQRGLRLHTANASLLRELALLAMARKNWLEAATLWRQVLSTQLGSASSEAYAGLIRAFRNAGNVEEAELALREARKRFPSDVRILSEQAVLENVAQPPPLRNASRSVLTEAQVEIIVCVFNAFDEMKACLEALAARTPGEQLLTLVDDASRPEVRAFLEAFVAQGPGRRLLVNEANQGYTRSANRGLKAARAEWALLLNSDTRVTESWLSGMLECAASDSKIRAVGPLSNVATFQSLPWTEGQTPTAETLERLATRVRELSWAAFPKVPMLNGFCLMLHKPTLNEVGYLDEANFPLGYGEENDLCLRLVLAGHKLAIADNVYVYHSKSASFGSDARKELTDNAVKTLRKAWSGYSYDYISEIIREIPALQQLRNAISVRV